MLSGKAPPCCQGVGAQSRNCYPVSPGVGISPAPWLSGWWPRGTGTGWLLQIQSRVSDTRSEHGWPALGQVGAQEPGEGTNLSEEEGSPSPAPAAEQLEGPPPHLWQRTPSHCSHHGLDLGPARLGWGEAKALVKTACQALLATPGGLGVIKSNDKCLAKNPFLKNALKEGWGSPWARHCRARETGALWAV